MGLGDIFRFKKKIAVAEGDRKLEHKNSLLNERAICMNKISNIENKIRFYNTELTKLAEELRIERKHKQQINSEIDIQ